MPQDNKDNDIAGMIKALSSQDPFMQVRAQQQMLQAGKRAVDALIDLVSKQRGRACLIGIELLTEIGDRRAVPALINLLQNGDAVLRQTAAGALGRFRDERARQPLYEALADTSTLTQMQAAKSLGELGGADTVTALMRVLEHANSEGLCYTIIEVLGRLGDRQAIPLIRRFESHESPFVRNRASQALKVLEASRHE